VRRCGDGWQRKGDCTTGQADAGIRYRGIAELSKDATVTNELDYTVAGSRPPAGSLFAGGMEIVISMVKRGTTGRRNRRNETGNPGKDGGLTEDSVTVPDFIARKRA